MAAMVRLLAGDQHRLQSYRHALSIHLIDCRILHIVAVQTLNFREPANADDFFDVLSLLGSLLFNSLADCEVSSLLVELFLVI